MLIEITERQRHILLSSVNSSWLDAHKDITDPTISQEYKERCLIGFEKELIELEDILMEHGK